VTWKHVATIMIGAAVALAGASLQQAAALTPVATLVIGGALGHAQSRRPPVRRRLKKLQQAAERPTL